MSHTVQKARHIRLVGRTRQQQQIEWLHVARRTKARNDWNLDVVRDIHS